MRQAEHRNFSSPNEVRTFDHGNVELVDIGGGTVGKLVLQPGWRWSHHVKPIAKTDWCMAPHLQYQIAGRLHIVMASGEELDSGPGDLTALPSGHDAWVVGSEPVVLIDWAGASNYAKD
jgi:hypothetical protein